jgi:putative nucleotidyltransferase with HDIG domain
MAVMSGGAVCTDDQDREDVRERVQTTLARLSRSGALPVLPGVASAALALVRNPDADFEELDRLIRSDVGLTARVLRVANRVGYGRVKPARTVREAALTIGLRKTCDLLVLACARELYDVPTRHASTLWKHALTVAVAAEELARTIRMPDPSSAFLPGLFHDVGRIGFLLADEMSYDVIFWLIANGSGEHRDLEVEWYEFDHAQASAVLAEQWGLEAPLCKAIGAHHAPDPAAEGGRLAEILNAADGLAYTLGCGTSDHRPPDIGLAQLGLSAGDEAACLKRIEEQVAQHDELLR